jgi:hypothetical protein
MTYAFLITSRKLVHYFQAHRIEEHTSSTLGKVLHNKDTTGRIVKWAIKLRVYDIVFKPRTTIKAQSFSDFIANLTVIQYRLS